ncbi:Protein N-acetyltransferase, RimJ/RimL family [Sphingomonas guangdongensis]|uniref:Protein N-acetyltransferase, RimJ/RimL family n=1 Tax=Sphingomonas guangdongensis TaxID=1141890 RepID=A0A285QG24_9SPHN|nr:GNAT family N-acetyltransferase [Sphingomonas guangdongensis]SOB79022.1 Protein N-acetyltransferase, RimJ/RimL family [Sphingomonas guangdongensis]
MIVTETERLVIREMEVGDAVPLHALLTDADFLRNIGHRGVDTVAEAEAAIVERYRPAYARHGDGMWAVVERGSGAWVGMAGLVRRPGIDHPDIGFALLPAGRGKGYAREAAGAVSAWATARGIAPVVAIVNPENAASRAVLAGLGLVPDRPIRLPGGDADVLLYVPVTPEG